ncbi:MAG: RNA polymerase sigma factor [Planctomycetota bacterium]
MDVTAFNEEEIDPRVIRKAQRGHRGSQAVLLRELQDVWYRYSYKMLSDDDKARDATQETGLRFLRGLPEFRGESRLKTWSLGITLNVCREMRRSRPHLALADADVPPASTTTPDQLVYAEQLDQLEQQLASLPERQREAITLRYLEQLSLRDTAAAMGCALGTAKATISQALRALRAREEAAES